MVSVGLDMSRDKFGIHCYGTVFCAPVDLCVPHAAQQTDLVGEDLL